MRERLDQANTISYKYATQRVFLGAVEIYCAAVEQFARALAETAIKSPGFGDLRDYLTVYVSSPFFLDLVTDISTLKATLSKVRYCLLLKDDSITVRAPEEESEYSAAVEDAFQKFGQEATQSYRLTIHDLDGVNHVQAQILGGVATLYPATFEALEAFSTSRRNYVDQTIIRFDREIQFYVAFLEYADRLCGAGLSFCLPELSETSKEISSHNAFDLVLAAKLLDDKSSVVCNDLFLIDPERIFVVSGPNHGGKTTFARMIGQMHYIANLGLPVPGTEARLFVFDHIFTHFEREEHITSRRGRLQDDLYRVRDILKQATTHSLVILNEIFSSTTLQDALYLSKQILAKFSALDLLCVCVTFLDELASFNDKTVSMVTAVDPGDAAVRTFKVTRRPADGLAYALAIAQKHRVTYSLLKERINE